MIWLRREDEGEMTVVGGGVAQGARLSLWSPADAGWMFLCPPRRALALPPTSRPGMGVHVIACLAPLL